MMNESCHSWWIEILWIVVVVVVYGFVAGSPFVIVCLVCCWVSYKLLIASVATYIVPVSCLLLQFYLAE